jgi:hypothetical protein
MKQAAKREPSLKREAERRLQALGLRPEQYTVSGCRRPVGYTMKLVAVVTLWGMDINAIDALAPRLRGQGFEVSVYKGTANYSSYSCQLTSAD